METTLQEIMELNDLGEKHAVEGNHEMALEVFRHISESKPDNFKNWNNMGVMLHALGRTDEAEGCFIRALSLKGDYEDAMENLKILAEGKDMIKTEAETMTSIETKGNDSQKAEEAMSLQVQIDEAARLVKEGRTEEAINAFSAIAGLYPHLKELYPVLCELYVCSGRTDIPADWIKAAVQCDLNCEQTFLALGEKLYSDGKAGEAMDVLSALLEAAPENHKAWNNYAVVLCSLGANMVAQAEQSINKSLSIRGDNGEALGNLRVVNELRNAMDAILGQDTGVEEKSKT